MLSVQPTMLITAQHNMLQKQLREQFMLAESVLNAMQAMPRENFVPENYKSVAYADFQIPLAHDEYMMLPNEEARMLAALNIAHSDKILEVGTGSSYVTALLATLGHSVISLDIHERFIKEAEQKLRNHGINNVKLVNENGVSGYEFARPFDVICITGGLHGLNHSILSQMRTGGRIFAIVGEHPSMTAILFTQDECGIWQTQSLFETQVGYLQNIPAFSEFHF